MKYCEFKDIDNGKMKCDSCGFSMAKKDNVIRVCQPKQEYPPLSTQIISLVSSVHDFITDGHIISKELYQARLNICNGTSTGEVCPYFDNNRCKKCGCYFKTKLSLSTEECPIGKWSKITNE
jgi:hypothetical protein